MKRSLSINEIASIIGNEPLALSIQNSIEAALKSPFVSLTGGKTVWDIFNHSLEAAIRDIDEHPKGILFRRLIEYGPLNPGEPIALISEKETILSDQECESCVDFIYSHMVNRFKGELAESLALDPCIELIQQLIQKGQIPSDTQLFWGESIQERRKIKLKKDNGSFNWGSFTKGADGLFVEKGTKINSKPSDKIKILGVIEIKSMILSTKKVLNQINNHIKRLSGGIKLDNIEWSIENIDIADTKNTNGENNSLVRIMVMPSNWQISRDWQSENQDNVRTMVFPEPTGSSSKSQILEINPNVWKITLDWSQEALNQAAYEMTFWYMSQVGRSVYENKKLPKGWEEMTPEQAGYNAIKMMLYYVILRPISKRHERLAIRLYNVYCFGYPLGVDSREMLWPEDFPQED
jgi:hypothetical protein